MDTIADNKAMVDKLLLPFPLLSDPNADLIKRFGIWNEDEHVAVPTIAVVNTDGMIAHFYSGRDFADRPGDDSIYTALDAMKRGGTFANEAVVTRVTAEEARQSVGPDRPAISLDQLVPYYQGAFYASVAIKGRLAAMGDGERAAVSEISAYQGMVREYRDALQATRATT